MQNIHKKSFFLNEANQTHENLNVNKISKYNGVLVQEMRHAQ